MHSGYTGLHCLKVALSVYGSKVPRTAPFLTPKYDSLYSSKLRRTANCLLEPAKPIGSFPQGSGNLPTAGLRDIDVDNLTTEDLCLFN